MSLSMQSKLLRALQEREVIRLGSSKVIPINVRIIVATHKDLLQEVKEGRFREDLYYRLLGIRLELPPLKERGNDIVLLAKSFVSEFCKENKLPNKDFSQDALEKLMHYSFPGNVRELKAIVEVAIVMSDSTILEADDILFNKRLDVDDFIQEDLTLEEYNCKIIKGYLIKHDNNVAKVSEKLQIGKSTIYRMIKEGKC
jgi:DNA-binding NtrC family response regulator